MEEIPLVGLKNAEFENRKIPEFLHYFYFRPIRNPIQCF